MQAALQQYGPIAVCFECRRLVLRLRVSVRLIVRLTAIDRWARRNHICPFGYSFTLTGACTTTRLVMAYIHDQSRCSHCWLGQTQGSWLLDCTQLVGTWLGSEWLHTNRARRQQVPDWIIDNFLTNNNGGNSTGNNSVAWFANESC